MSKVYLVSEGSYSAYRIVAIFDNREEAEAFAGGANEQDGYDGDVGVEERELGRPLDEEPFRLMYRIAMILEDGHVVEDRRDVICPRMDREQKPKDWSRVYQPRETHLIDRGSVMVIDSESCISQKHAIKIAGEMRQQILARRAEGLS